MAGVVAFFGIIIVLTVTALGLFYGFRSLNLI